MNKNTDLDEQKSSTPTEFYESYEVRQEEWNLPSPDECKMYEQHINNFGERYFRLVEESAKTSILMQKEQIRLQEEELRLENRIIEVDKEFDKNQNQLEKSAQMYSILITVIASLLSAYAIFKEQYLLSSVFFGATLLGIITTFFKGRKK